MSMTGLAGRGKAACRNASPVSASPGRKIQQSRRNQPRLPGKDWPVGGRPFSDSTQPPSFQLLPHNATRSSPRQPACVSKLASVKFLANLDLAGATLPQGLDRMRRGVEGGPDVDQTRAGVLQARALQVEGATGGQEPP